MDEGVLVRQVLQELVEEQVTTRAASGIRPLAELLHARDEEHIGGNEGCVRIERVPQDSHEHKAEREQEKATDG